MRGSSIFASAVLLLVAIELSCSSTDNVVGLTGGHLPNVGNRSSGSDEATAGSVGGALNAPGAHAGGNEAVSGKGGGVNEAVSGKGGGGGVSGSVANGAPATCMSLIDDKSLLVPVLIRNELTYAIFLGPQQDPCSEAPLFDVRDAGGQLIGPPGHCRASRESYMSGDTRGGCVTDCPVAQAVMIEPGSSFSTYWAGLSDFDRKLPEECASMLPGPAYVGAQCEQKLVVPSGRFVFGAKAGSAINCLTTDVYCGCVPGDTGTCTTLPGLVRGVPLSTSTTVDIDSGGQNDVVTLVFDHGP